MTVQRMDHVGLVVGDLAAAIAFFLELGLEQEGEAPVGGRWVDRLLDLDGVRADIAMLRTPDGNGHLELSAFRTPASPGGDRRPPANAVGLRHLSFTVDDLDAAIARLQAHGAELLGSVEQYEDIYRLCYVRGPEGVLVELAQRIA